MSRKTRKHPASIVPRGVQQIQMMQEVPVNPLKQVWNEGNKYAAKFKTDLRHVSPAGFYHMIYLMLVASRWPLELQLLSSETCCNLGVCKKNARQEKSWTIPKHWLNLPVRTHPRWTHPLDFCILYTDCHAYMMHMNTVKGQHRIYLYSGWQNLITFDWFHICKTSQIVPKCH